MLTYPSSVCEALIDVKPAARGNVNGYFFSCENRFLMNRCFLMCCQYSGYEAAYIICFLSKIDLLSDSFFFSVWFCFPKHSNRKRSKILKCIVMLIFPRQIKETWMLSYATSLNCLVSKMRLKLCNKLTRLSSYILTLKSVVLKRNFLFYSQVFHVYLTNN